MKQTKNATKSEIPLKKKILYIALFILSIYSLSCFQQLCYSEDDARHWYYKGNIKIDAQKYGEAKESFSKAIEIDPNCEEAYFKRGEVYFALAEYKNAISDFTKVIELNPHNAEAYFDRGKVYNEIKYFDLAIVDFSEVIRISSKIIEAYSKRGWAYKNINKIDYAINDYRRGCELGDSNACFALESILRQYNIK